MKQLILYDLDGTLVDTLEDITDAVNHMLHQLGRERLSACEVRRYVGHGLQQLVQRCVKTDDSKTVEQGVKIYRAYYTQHLLDHSRLYPGALEILEFFKMRRQAVITNKPDPYSRQILTALGIVHYFVDIVAGNSSYPKKPHPASILALMQQQQLLPSQVLFIGDSPIDIEAGHNAGVLTVSVSHGLVDAEELAAAAPDRLVNNFQELLQLAQEQGW